MKRKALQVSKVIVLPFGSVHDLDKTAIEMLRELLTEWRKRRVEA